jgi:hypothetical protein
MPLNPIELGPDPGMTQNSFGSNQLWTQSSWVLQRLDPIELGFSLGGPKISLGPTVDGPISLG